MSWIRCSAQNPVNAYKLGFNINQAYLRANFNYFLSASHTPGADAYVSQNLAPDSVFLSVLALVGQVIGARMAAGVSLEFEKAFSTML